MIRSESCCRSILGISESVGFSGVQHLHPYGCMGLYGPLWTSTSPGRDVEFGRQPCPGLCGTLRVEGRKEAEGSGGEKEGAVRGVKGEKDPLATQTRADEKDGRRGVGRGGGGKGGSPETFPVQAGAM